MKLDRVTITGADDSIMPVELVPLSQKYPFVEWGILFSHRQQGSPRFPGLKFLTDLLDTASDGDPKLKLSAHLCGQWVRDIVEQGDNTWLLAHEAFWGMFDRIQLNFHGNWHKISAAFLELVPTFEGKQIIFQVDGINDMAWAQCQNHCDAVPFFDASHGAGISPAEWPKPYSGVYNGYSGGLGPANLTEQIQAIQELASGTKEAAEEARFWVDMETKVRSKDNKKFDLVMVESCLSQAAPFIEK